MSVRSRKRNRKRNRWISVLPMILILLIGFAAFIFWKQEEIGRANYKDYKILVRNATYSPATRTGFLEVEVCYRKLRGDKLFLTSDDVIGDGDKTVVDEEHLLRIMQGDKSFLTKAREVKNTAKAQFLNVYFINESEDYTEDPFSLTVSENTIDNKVVDVDTHMIIEDESVNFTDGVSVHVSATGVVVDVTGTAYYDRYASEIVSMKLQWIDHTKVLMFAKNIAQAKDVGDTEIVVPELILNESEKYRYRIYAVQLEDWQDVLSVQIGDHQMRRNPKDEEERQAIEEHTREKYSEVLTKAELAEYDTGITFEDLREHPSDYEIDTKMILTGIVTEVNKEADWGYRIRLDTSQGEVTLYIEGQEEPVQIYSGEECVACVCYRGTLAETGRVGYSFKAAVVKEI